MTTIANDHQRAAATFSGGEAAPVADIASNDRPIFIVGCARSGTTLLQLMLHSHPRIAIPPETRFMIELYDKRTEFGDLDNKDRRAGVASWIVDRKRSKFHDLKLNKNAVRKQIIDGPPTIGSAAGIVLREYAARQGKPRWGDKRPNYIERIDTLIKLFPDAQFVHIIRDGRDCVASLKKMPWWKHPFRCSVYKWIKAIECGNHARKTLRKDQYYEFKYEDLVANPEKELRALCGFLKEDFHPAMLEHHKTAEIAVPEQKMEWHYRTKQAVNSDAVGKWLKDLKPQELALMEKMAAKQLRQYGYAPSGRRESLPLKVQYNYHKHVLRTWISAQRRKRAESQRARAYGLPVQALLTRGQQQPNERGNS